LKCQADDRTMRRSADEFNVGDVGFYPTVSIMKVKNHNKNGVQTPAGDFNAKWYPGVITGKLRDGAMLMLMKSAGGLKPQSMKDRCAYVVREDFRAWTDDSVKEPFEIANSCGFRPKRGTFVDPASKILIGYDNIFLPVGTFTEKFTEAIKDFDLESFLDCRMQDTEGGSVYLHRYVNKQHHQELDGTTVVSSRVSVSYGIALQSLFQVEFEMNDPC